MTLCEVCGKHLSSPQRETALLTALEALRGLEGDELQSLSTLVGQLGSKASELYRVAAERTIAELTQQKEALRTCDDELYAVKGKAINGLIENASALPEILQGISAQRDSGSATQEATQAVSEVADQPADVKITASEKTSSAMASGSTPKSITAKRDSGSAAQEATRAMSEVADQPADVKITSSEKTSSGMAVGSTPTIRVPADDELEAQEKSPTVEKSPSFGLASATEATSEWESPKFGPTSVDSAVLRPAPQGLSATMPPAIPSPRPGSRPLPSPLSSTSQAALAEVVSNRPGAALFVAVPGASGAMNPIAKRRQLAQQQMALSKSGRIARHHQGAKAATPKGVSKPASPGLGIASNHSGVGSESPAPTDEVSNADAAKNVSMEQLPASMDSPLSSGCPLPSGPPATHGPPLRSNSFGANPYDVDVSPISSPTGQSVANMSPPRSPAAGLYYNGPSAYSKVIDTSSYDNVALGGKVIDTPSYDDVALGGSQHHRVPEDLLTKDDLDWNMDDDDFRAPEPACRTRGFMCAPPSGSFWGGSLGRRGPTANAPALEPIKPVPEAQSTSRLPSKSRSQLASEDLEDPVADLKRTLTGGAPKAAAQQAPATNLSEDPDDPLEDLRRTLGGRDRSSAPSRESSQQLPRQTPQAPVAPKPTSGRPGVPPVRRSCFTARSCNASLSPRTPLGTSIIDESLTPTLIS